FCPTALASSVFSHFSSSPAVILTASWNSAYVSVSLMVEGLRLVHGLAAGFVAFNLLFRAICRTVARTAGFPGPGRDLLLDLAVDRLAVALPCDLLAFVHHGNPHTR